MGEIQQLKGRERTNKEGDKQEGGGEGGEVKYVMCCGGGERGQRGGNKGLSDRRE